MRVLGVDYGFRKVGLALGDTDLRLASPLDVWEHGGSVEDLCSRLAAFAKQEDVDTLVVGVPKTCSGEDTEQGHTHRKFCEQLRSLTSLPVVEVDESFTSVEGRRLQEETGVEVSEDALAAMLILEEYFAQV